MLPEITLAQEDAGRNGFVFGGGGLATAK